MNTRLWCDCLQKGFNMIATAEGVNVENFDFWGGRILERDIFRRTIKKHGAPEVIDAPRRLVALFRHALTWEHHA